MTGNFKCSWNWGKIKTADKKFLILDYKKGYKYCYLNECLTLELENGDKTCNFMVVYRSPSRFQDEFETFSDNFEMTLDILA